MRQEQGYTELYTFLFYSARRRYTHVGAEATQRALERIYIHFASCRQPQTFLAFALQKLRDAARAELRTELRAAETLPDSDSALASASQVAAAGARPDPADQAIRNDLLEHIGRCARRFVQRHPRAAQQFAALWMRHIEGLDDEMIGRRLGTTGAAVQVMRSRVARRLRGDPDWQLLAYDLGVLS
jgi:DNA-directed RNA polymerase specialized sigma24 family protein